MSVSAPFQCADFLKTQKSQKVRILGFSGLKKTKILKSKVRILVIFFHLCN